MRSGNFLLLSSQCRGLQHWYSLYLKKICPCAALEASGDGLCVLGLVPLSSEFPAHLDPSQIREWALIFPCVAIFVCVLSFLFSISVQGSIPLGLSKYHFSF